MNNPCIWISRTIIDPFYLCINNNFLFKWYFILRRFSRQVIKQRSFVRGQWNKRSKHQCHLVLDRYVAFLISVSFWWIVVRGFRGTYIYFKHFGNLPGEYLNVSLDLLPCGTFETRLLLLFLFLMGYRWYVEVGKLRKLEGE